MTNKAHTPAIPQAPICEAGYTRLADAWGVRFPAPEGAAAGDRFAVTAVSRDGRRRDVVVQVVETRAAWGGGREAVAKVLWDLDTPQRSAAVAAEAAADRAAALAATEAAGGGYVEPACPRPVPAAMAADWDAGWLDGYNHRSGTPCPDGKPTWWARGWAAGQARWPHPERA